MKHQEPSNIEEPLSDSEGPRHLVNVSVVVLTHMEEANIASCLRSVAGWADDIHVVDSGSSDRTLEIAEQFAHHVHRHAYVDHTTQIQYVLNEVPLRHDWLLLLDADHVVTRELQQSIDSMLLTERSGIDLYYFPQVYVFQGQEIRSLKKWGRLIKHKNVKVEGGELVDFRYLSKGPIGYLHGHVIEHNLKENDLDFWIDKHQKFASRMAIEEVLRRSGALRWSIRPKLLGNPDERLVWMKNRWYALPLFVRPFIYFGYRYFWKLGFLEGKTGFVFHFLQAFWFRMVVDVKLADLERRLASRDVTIADLNRDFGHSASS